MKKLLLVCFFLFSVVFANNSPNDPLPLWEEKNSALVFERCLYMNNLLSSFENYIDGICENYCEDAYLVRLLQNLKVGLDLMKLELGFK